jgi:exosortase A
MAVFAAICVVLLVLFRETVSAMVEIWYRSDTFNHGFIVLPISVWLIWKRRSTLATAPVGSEPLVLLPIALAAFGWLLGDLAGVNAVTQLTFVALLVLLVPALLGRVVARSIVFPLGFLFFMVPIGEFAMPTLMDWTAEFTVLALRLTGIPVYQEGLHFVIPSGRWSVVEACSGVRYLIASFCVGTIYAYLTYTSPKRRLVFAVVAILVPIVANWLRAYMIVMIGHLSDGKLAAGVDHLIYGWVFFGVVMLIMFMIGSRWAEPEAAEPVASANEATTVEQRPWQWPVAIGVLLLVVSPHLVVEALDRAAAAAGKPTVRLPDVGGWQQTVSSETWTPAYDGASASARSAYERDGRRVEVYVAYYRKQDYVRKLVSSNNVLVRSKDTRWVVMSSGKKSVDGIAQPVEVRTAELRGETEQRLRVWHWYWINGQTTTSDHRAKLLTGLERLQGRGDDSAAVFISAPRDESNPDMAIEAFLRDAAGQIAIALDTARGPAARGMP